jgi:acyl-CoA synthetase (AMP-forming)/AMP-acid ligase II
MIYKGPYAEVDIPEVPLTSFVLQKAGLWGGKPALIDGLSGESITYEQLANAIQHAAAGLAQRGFQKGDVMAIYSPNLPAYAVAFHAVATLGGLNTTVNPLYTTEELTFQLQDARAKYLLTIPQLLDKAIPAARQAGIDELFVFGEAEGASPFAALLQNDGILHEVPIDPKEDLVALPYSSGTTGLPKGVMLTHYNLVANLCQITPVDEIEPNSVLIGILPFFHIYGLLVILNFGLYLGATIVTMPRFDLEQFLGIIRQYRVTRAPIVPPIILALAKHPVVDQYDLSSLKVVMSGAAPLSKELAEACSHRLRCVVKQGYGLTETSPVTHINPDKHAVAKPGSVGPPIPNTECKIVDVSTGESLGYGKEGEVCIRGPQVMTGYLNNPEATAAMIDPEGWLHTGDVGYVDEDGCFYIIDRVKELIKYKGFQVAPAELEAILLTHPAIADAAVIPSPDEEAGEVPKAFIVRKGDINEAQVMEHVAGHVAPYKRIRLVEFIDQIPKSPSGKILRRVLVQKERGE